jgi:DNA-directed RNA polymerase subunit RPC12/RpoP
MGKCAQCGNDYDKSFEVTMGGRTLVFDSFECAIQALAPACPNCGNRIIGHGVQHGDEASRACATAIRL